MKPLSEWTESELRSALTSQHIFGVFELQAAIDELLRRERERVAKALDDRWADGRDEHRGWDDAAAFVRGMR